MQKRERFKIPIAVFLILIKDHEMLLIKRATTGWKDGYYSLPAGCLEENEDVLVAAIREAKEEVGVKVNKENVKLVYTQHCFVDQQNWINLYFTTTEWEGVPQVCEPEKHSEVCWTSLSALPDMIIEYVKDALLNSSKKIAYGLFLSNH